MMSPFSLPQPPSPIRCSDDEYNHDVPRHHYQYVPFDIFEIDWLGDPRRLPLVGPSAGTASAVGDSDNSGGGNAIGKNPLRIARYSPGTLVWVMLSKGKPKHEKNSTAANTTTTTLSGCADALAIHKKRRDKKNKRKTTNNNSSSNDCTIKSEIMSHQSEELEAPTIVTGRLQEEEDESTSTSTTSNAFPTVNRHSRKQFFLRARVVADDEKIITSPDIISSSVLSSHWERRVLVRYSRGTTYRVHAYNLIPVLEPNVHNVSSSLSTTTAAKCPYNSPPLVVLVPETNIYRRVAKVHTTSEDTFMEIGCDYGITVETIRQSLEEAGDVPRVWREETIMDAMTGDDDKDDICDDEEEEEEDNHHRVSCLGIDKSVESINIANKRCDTK